MGTRSGLNAQAALSIETVKNTRQLPTTSLGFVSEAIGGGPEQIKSKALMAGRRLTPRFAAGRKMYAGPISFELQAEAMSKVLRLMFGAVVDAGAGPFTHTFTPGDLPSATIEIGRPERDSDTVNAYEYIGSMCSSWSMAIDPSNGFTDLTVNIVAFDEDMAQTLITPTYAAATPLLFSHAVLTVAGSPLCFDTMTLTGDNGLKTDQFKVCAASLGRATIGEEARRTYGGTFTADYDGFTQYQRFVNGTEAALTLIWTAGASAILNIAGNIRFTGTTPNVGGPEIVKQAAPFEFVHATSDASAFTAILTNSDAT